MKAFVGIDVAFAKGKPLPICVCTWESDRLTPFPIRGANLPDVPRGSGNRGSIDEVLVTTFVDKVAEYLYAIEKHCGLEIQRVAIDAPSAPRTEGLVRRLAEGALDCKRISCFTTPKCRRIRYEAAGSCEISGKWRSGE